VRLHPADGLLALRQIERRITSTIAAALAMGL
jgi:hypothetical protein